MKGYRDSWSTYLSCIYHVRGDIPPRTTLPLIFCSSSLGFEPLIAIRSSSNYSCSRPRPKVQYIIWALSPTIAPQNSNFSLLSEEKMWGFNLTRTKILYSTQHLNNLRTLTCSKTTIRGAGYNHESVLTLRKIKVCGPRSQTCLMFCSTT